MGGLLRWVCGGGFFYFFNQSYGGGRWFVDMSGLLS